MLSPVQPNNQFTDNRVDEADLLDGKFLDGAVDDLANLVLETMELHGKDVRQSESLGVHVKRLSRLLHQFLPVSGRNTD